MLSRRTPDPTEAARFRSNPDLGFPTAEISAVTEPEGDRKPRMTVSLIGLIGAAGALPRLYGELAAASLRQGAAGLLDFIDMLSQRMIGCFAHAGIKYRLARSTARTALTSPPALEPIATTLLALSGHGLPGVVERLPSGPEPLLHYSGLFAMRPRSAERLTALVSDWLGCRVEVLQFAGNWLSLPVDQRTALAINPASQGLNRLGIDAVIGVRAWDTQASIVIRIGPLDRAGFGALLPGRIAHIRLVSIVQAFLGLEVAFAINPVLSRDAASPLTLSEVAQPRLGWNSWIATPGRPAASDATDAVFESA
jgi:type VI secretion system protein ImpH